jgi:hypothetical protein
LGLVLARKIFVAEVCGLLLAAGAPAVAALAVHNITAQTAADTTTKPTEHVLGTITSVDPAAHTITVKDDKSGTEHVVSTANTRTLIKVLPTAKDLKGATRITAEDLSTGDRVDIRGFKDEAKPDTIAARSVVLMSARELQAKHQADAAAWQNSTAGTVTAVDPAAHTLAITSRTPQGPQQITVQVPPSAELTRYSPESPKTPVASQLADVQPGDQVKVIGSRNGDGSSLTAERVYSGAFRTIAGTITAVNPDGKGLTIQNLQTKRPMQVSLTELSAVHKLPPEMAAMAARRLGGNSGAGMPPGAGQPPRTPAAGVQQGGTETRQHQRGDLSQMVQHLPTISLADLKPGDAVIVSGVLGSDKGQLIASNIIAGVEPMLQSGGARQVQASGDWSLDMAMPTQ